jgi:hypothetical protein
MVAQGLKFEESKMMLDVVYPRGKKTGRAVSQPITAPISIIATHPSFPQSLCKSLVEGTADDASPIKSPEGRGYHCQYPES